MGRARIAATLHLSRPDPPAGQHDTIPAPQLAVARAGVRILAAVGALPLPVLAAAVTRARASATGTHRRTATRPPRYTRSAAPSMTPAAGTHPAGSPPPTGTRVIVTQAAG